MDASSLSSESRLKRPKLVPYYRIAVILMVAIVLVQAFLGGRGLFIVQERADYIDLHEIVANLVFLNALVLLGLAIALGAPSAWRTALIAPNALLVVLVIGQIALGYNAAPFDEGSGSSLEAGAWHVPNGVLIFGLSVFLLSLLPRLKAAALSGG